MHCRSQTEGYSGAELTLLCREAALLALQEDINTEKVFSKNTVNFHLCLVCCMRVYVCVCAPERDLFFN
jgi:SpoVK/Ycf46/Vps4 family AAA+-type ATPase